MSDVIEKINHPKIKYEKIWNIAVDNGLNWIISQEDIDMVAIVHHHHPVLRRIFKGSHTQKLSRQIEVPLLVFPPDDSILKS